jgi:hypothetical protein
MQQNQPQRQQQQQMQMQQPMVPVAAPVMVPQQIQQQPPQQPILPQPTAPGWQAVLDPVSGVVYYYNASTGERSWTDPVWNQQMQAQHLKQ